MSTARDAGLAALQSGDVQTAIAQLEAAVQENPSDFDACLYLGGAYGQSGRPLDAIKSVTQAVQLQPSNAQARYNLGVAMEQGGYSEQALQVYNQAVQLQPDYPKAQEAVARLHASSNQGFGAAAVGGASASGSGQQFQVAPEQPAQQLTQQFAQPPVIGQQQVQPYNPLAPEPQQAQPYNPLAPAPQQGLQPTQAFAPQPQQTPAFGRPTLPVGQPQQPVEAGLGSYMAPPPPAARPAAPGAYGAPTAYGARPGAYSSLPSYDDEFKLGQAFKDMFRALFTPRTLLSEMAGCDTTRSAWALFVVYSLITLGVYGIVGLIIGSKVGGAVIGLVAAELYGVIGVVSLLLMWALFALIVHMMSRAFGSSLRYGASMRCVIYSGAPSVLMGLVMILGIGLIASSAIGLVKSTPGMMDSFTSSSSAAQHSSGYMSGGSRSSSTNPFATPGGANTNPFRSSASSGSTPFGSAATPGSGPFSTGAPGSSNGMPGGPMTMLVQQIMGAYLMLGLIGLVSTVWIMVLLGVAISNVHEVSGGTAAGVVVLSTLIYMVVSVGLMIVMSIMFAGMFGALGAAAAGGMH